MNIKPRDFGVCITMTLSGRILKIQKTKEAWSFCIDKTSRTFPTCQAGLAWALSVLTVAQDQEKAALLEKDLKCLLKIPETQSQEPGAGAGSPPAGWFCCGVKWPWSRLHCQCGEHRPE